MEKILVIGGCGYIGSRVMQLLTSQGYDTVSMDLEWFGKFTTFENYPEDFSYLQEHYLHQFRTVILLAGHSSVKMCAANMLGTFKNNVVNFVNLISKLRVDQRFIYASSSSIYGGNLGKNVDESSDKYVPLNFYDLSKYEIDSYAKLHNHPEYYGLRFGTVNGFSLNFRDDVMLNAMYKASLNGGLIKVSNPLVNRPILGITDLCKSILTIIKYGDPGKSGIYNLASFNAKVETIGQEAAGILNTTVELVADKQNVYDFTISTKLFEETFDFKFSDTTESILSEISRGQAQLMFSNRNTAPKYE